MTRSEAEAAGERAADLLAVALEEVGFDVGRAFPALHGTANLRGAPAVELGAVSEHVATGLASVLGEAARLGITLPDD
jgi:hypothetical protein